MSEDFSAPVGVDGYDPGVLVPLVVETPQITVRNGPGTTFKEIGSLKKGDRLPVADTRQDWYRVIMADGRSGWIPMTSAAIDTVFR